ncbi:ABC transporter substrate-binding protein [Acetobacterium fimetarium]|uniref:ABC transporter substrate-binding protein n=2 Tax=Acetobacterium fimetarium TaxID=52691 RepID=A0ABR6WVY7_9FIRM|nr:ABC transporter substrate-binding protein [Acetobacterium fimetarium]
MEKKMKRKIVGMMLVVAMVATLATGCSSNSTAKTSNSTKTGTHTVVDLAGREVTIPNDVTKVATLCGPSYETAIMLGAADQVVMTGNKMGATGWANVICPEFANIPVSENAMAPNVEELVSKGTQVVLYWDAYPDVIKALEDAGIAVVVTQLDKTGVNTDADFLKLKEKEVTLVGDVFGGDAVEKAQKWCEYAEKTTTSITSKTANLTANEIPSVYYVRGPEALSIHGGQSYTNYLVDMAGGSLVSKADDELLYTTTMEQVVQWNPEYIFMGRVNNIELITQDPAWSSIQAVKNGKVYVNLKGVGVADYSTDCFLLMEQIAKTLHPDLFKDLNMTEEIKSYYNDFYNYKLTDEQANLILTFKTPEGK